MGNGIAIFLTILGLLLIVGGFFVGVYIAEETTVTGFNFELAIVYWIYGLLSGSFFIGLGKIVDQLAQIIEQNEEQNE